MFARPREGKVGLVRSIILGVIWWLFRTPLTPLIVALSDGSDEEDTYEGHLGSVVARGLVILAIALGIILTMGLLALMVWLIWFQK